MSGIKRKLNHISFRVTINNFSTRKESVGEKILTDNFSCPDDSDHHDSYQLDYPPSILQWHLQVFPRGREERFSNYVAVFLHLVTRTGETKSIQGSFSLGLLNQDNQLVFGRKCSGEFEPGRGWGYANYFSRTDILDGDNLILSSSDQLTLVCDLYFADCKILSRQHFDSLLNLSGFNLQSSDGKKMNDFNYHVKQLFDDQTITDVTILTEGGKSIGAHKCVLIQSPKLLDMVDTLENQESVIDMTDFDYESVRTMINFMITETFDCGHRDVDSDNENSGDNNLYKLLQLATKYKLDSMKFRVQQELFDKLNLSNCLEMLINAEELNCNELKNVIGYFIVDNISSLNLSVSDWKESLTPTLLAELIVMLSHKKAEDGHRQMRSAIPDDLISESNTSSPPPPPYHSLPPPSHVSLPSPPVHGYGHGEHSNVHGQGDGHHSRSSVVTNSLYQLSQFRRHNPPH